ncbi:hypothetical protein M9434_000611 [Picochlorum sp. BPE23]|nr:hypothetical protein M9434_000611 [Picochlorum sp. BPE23]KAI8111361.1 hypothetical protein M9435_003862 [Picochlorum sp. BPE23]WPT12498.1 Transmembrane protein 50A [Picochlorum sp. SENEW3]
MKALVDWFVYDFDREELEDRCRKYGGLVAGAFFGAGWWSWADALVTQRGVEGESSAPFKYAWPGIIATIAMVLINMLSKDSLQDIADSGDEETNTRARLWLLCSFLLCFGSIAASIAVLISCTEQGQYVAVGVGSVLQCGFILASALILWVFRTRS